MDDEGNIILPSKPGLGFEVNWECAKENKLTCALALVSPCSADSEDSMGRC